MTSWLRGIWDFILEITDIAFYWFARNTVNFVNSYKIGTYFLFFCIVITVFIFIHITKGYVRFILVSAGMTIYGFFKGSKVVSEGATKSGNTAVRGTGKVVKGTTKVVKGTGKVVKGTTSRVKSLINDIPL